MWHRAKKKIAVSSKHLYIKHGEKPKKQKMQRSFGNKPKKPWGTPKKTKKTKISGTMPTISSKLPSIVPESFGFFGFFGFPQSFFGLFPKDLWIFWFFWFSRCFWHVMKRYRYLYICVDSINIHTIHRQRLGATGLK